MYCNRHPYRAFVKGIVQVYGQGKYLKVSPKVPRCPSPTLLHIYSKTFYPMLTRFYHKN